MLSGLLKAQEPFQYKECKTQAPTHTVLSLCPCNWKTWRFCSGSKDAGRWCTGAVSMSAGCWCFWVAWPEDLLWALPACSLKGLLALLRLGRLSQLSLEMPFLNLFPHRLWGKGRAGILPCFPQCSFVLTAHFYIWGWYYYYNWVEMKIIKSPSICSPPCREENQ